MQKDVTLDVTVAICTWNRRTLLESTFESLERMKVSPSTRWELVVIDNGSTDGTAEVVANWISRGTLPLRYVHEPILGLSNARNRAIREARTEWLLFTDDDVIVEPDWLEGFVQASKRNPTAGAIGGRVDPWFVETPDQMLCEAFPALAKGYCGLDLGPEERLVPEGTDLVGANFAIRIDDTNRLFNPNLGPIGANPIGGDELAYQMELRKSGLPIVWTPNMRLKHYVDPPRMSLDYLQKFYTNVGRHEVMLHGIPKGTRLAGAPRWLLGLYARHVLRRVVSVISGNTLEAHRSLRQQWQIGGMIAECRKTVTGTK
jgi:glycosyltransferase involved in cell wall biosynthesis